MALRKPVKRKLTAKTVSKTRPLKAPKKGGDFSGPAKHKVKKGGAFDRVEKEKKKAELNANKPWNVIVPVGGSLTVYTLDDSEPFACYQHLNHGGSKGQRGRDLPCIQDGPEPCPICAQEGKDGTYVMYLTAVVPLDSYVKKDGTKVTRHYQKKLLQIKVKMAGQWKRIYEEHGTFRGLVLKLHRDGKLDPISGNQIQVVKKLSEAKLRHYAGGTEVKDKDARDFIIKAEIDKVYDYEKLFPSPKASDLAAMAGVGTSTAGMRLGEEDGDDWGSGDDAGSDWGED